MACYFQIIAAEKAQGDPKTHFQISESGSGEAIFLRRFFGLLLEKKACFYNGS